MTKLVTNTKFSLPKAKAPKCWRKAGKEVGRWNSALVKASWSGILQAVFRSSIP